MGTVTHRCTGYTRHKQSEDGSMLLTRRLLEFHLEQLFPTRSLCNRKALTLNSKPSTLNPRAQTPNP